MATLVKILRLRRQTRLPLIPPTLPVTHRVQQNLTSLNFTTIRSWTCQRQRHWW